MTTSTLENLDEISRHLQADLQNIGYSLRRKDIRDAKAARREAVRNCDRIVEILRMELLVAPAERLHSSTEANA